MTTTINNMFEINEEAVEGRKTLEGTAMLVSISAGVVDRVMQKINSDMELYAEALEQSKFDNARMDDLLRTVAEIDSVDTTYLSTIDEEQMLAMLKSQQSKRSRCKSKQMTLNNYRDMMNAAVSETLIRLVLGKDKAAVIRRSSTSLEYTAEELEMFKNDQELLRRELRNVQSKKSIHRAKDSFDEENAAEDTRWQALLQAEASLKEIREPGARGASTVFVDTTAKLLKAELGDTDVNDLKAADAKALLKRLLESAAAQ